MQDTIDPFLEARKVLLREGECYFFLCHCMKLWKNLPNDENRGMIRNYINSHLVNKGYAALTEDNIDDRFKAASAVCVPTFFHLSQIPYLLGQWSYAWEAVHRASDKGTDYPGLILKKAMKVTESIRDAKPGMALSVFYSSLIHSSQAGVLRILDRDAWLWWCALYAMHGKEMFQGKGYT